MPKNLTDKAQKINPGVGKEVLIFTPSWPYPKFSHPKFQDPNCPPKLPQELTLHSSRSLQCKQSNTQALQRHFWSAASYPEEQLGILYLCMQNSSQALCNSHPAIPWSHCLHFQLWLKRSATLHILLFLNRHLFLKRVTLTSEFPFSISLSHHSHL